jgi:hypothetical protein
MQMYNMSNDMCCSPQLPPELEEAQQRAGAAKQQQNKRSAQASQVRHAPTFHSSSWLQLLSSSSTVRGELLQPGVHTQPILIAQMHRMH